MSVTSPDTTTAGTRPRGRLGHKIGIGISVLVGAFLVFDAVGKLAGVPQVKEGTAALGFPVEPGVGDGHRAGASAWWSTRFRGPRCSGRSA